jgi:hypothetical protein
MAARVTPKGSWPRSPHQTNDPSILMDGEKQRQCCEHDLRWTAHMTKRVNPDDGHDDTRGQVGLG